MSCRNVWVQVLVLLLGMAAPTAGIAEEPDAPSYFTQVLERVEADTATDSVGRGEGYGAAGTVGEYGRGEMEHQAESSSSSSSFRSRHEACVYWWQFWSSLVVFAIVCGMVIWGCCMASQQFRAELRTRRPAGSGTKLGIGKDGVSISSGMTGIIILVVSFAFFTAYLIFVYPIKETAGKGGGHCCSCPLHADQRRAVPR